VYEIDVIALCILILLASIHIASVTVVVVVLVSLVVVPMGCRWRCGAEVAVCRGRVVPPFRPLGVLGS
jgi:hypothetical protein